MKINTKWITTAVAVTALSATLAIAGVNGDGHGRGFEGRGHGAFGEKLAAKLNLTDAQKEQWKAIRNTSRQQNEAFFSQARQTMQDFRAAKEAGDTAKIDALKPTVESQRAQMKQIRAAEEQQLMNILTADQKAQFATLKAQHASREKKQN